LNNSDTGQKEKKEKVEKGKATTKFILLEEITVGYDDTLNSEIDVDNQSRNEDKPNSASTTSSLTSPTPSDR